MRIVTYLSQFTSLFAAILIMGFAGGLLSNQANAANDPNIPDIQANWTEAEFRIDGSAIQSIDEYKLYSFAEGSALPVISVPGAELGYLIEDVSPGKYILQISTVEDGLEGPLSDPVSLEIIKTPASKPAKMVFTVEFVNCENCGFEVN